MSRDTFGESWPSHPTLPRADVQLIDAPHNKWRLVEPYSYYDSEHDVTITVPAGFEFDLASVPRFFWRIIAPFELGIEGPLVHDAAYGTRGFPAGWTDPERMYTRKEVDALLLHIAGQGGASPWKRRAAYAVVRAFGRGAWG